MYPAYPIRERYCAYPKAPHCSFIGCQNFKVTKRALLLSPSTSNTASSTRYIHHIPGLVVTTEPNTCKDVGQAHPVSDPAVFPLAQRGRTVIVTEEKGHTAHSLPQYRHRQLGQVQAEEMSPGVQEGVSRRQDRQAVYRSRQLQQDRLHQ